MKTQTEKTSEEELIRHIEHHEKDTLVRKILTKETSFRRRVEEFYGLSSREKIGLGRIPIMYTVYKCEEEDSNKIGGLPADLFEIVKPFTEKKIDADKLKYEDVRLDFNRWVTSPKRRYTRNTCGLISLAGILATTLGVVAGLDYFLESSNPNLQDGLFYSLGAIGLMTVIPSYYFAFFSELKPKGTNYELREYHKLIDASEEADNFINKVYKDFFVEKTLNQN